MNRPDLLALTEEALVALANRGLVNRARKDPAPNVRVDGDGTVRGEFPGGVLTQIPQAGFAAGSCSCAAPGVCRHRIGLVLAYQRESAIAMPAFTRWSPGDITDEELARRLGHRVLAAARRRHRAGYPARLHRPTPERPEPSADLGSATVRFLVPGQLDHVHSDAADGNAVALAVWAFREADSRELDGDEIALDVGGGAVAVASGLDVALELVAELLLDGAMHAGSAGFGRARRDLDARNLRWPLAAVDELAGQLAAYHGREAQYRAERFAELLTEIHARHRAVTNSGASPRSLVLGDDEPARTPLRRVRLTGLGCRVNGGGTAEVFLADRTGTVLVLRVPGHPGADLAGRRVAGTTVAGLAAGILVTDTAVRSASRVIRLASNRVARSTVVPSHGDWSDLVADVASLNQLLADLPPRLIRPRVEAELVRAVALTEVRDIGYHPGEQRLDAVIADPAGNIALIRADYRAACPGALDTLEAALRGNPRFVSGSVRRTRGTLVIDPLAVVDGTTVVVPDLAPGDGATALPAAAPAPADPVLAALDHALALCAEAAHRGLRHLPADLRPRLERAADDLVHTGLPAAARVVSRLAAAMAREPAAIITAWVDAQLRLMITVHYHLETEST